MYFNLLSKFYFYPFDFSTPKSSLRAVTIWLTIALIIGFITTCFLLKKPKKTTFLKAALAFFTGYACVVAVVSLTLAFIDNANDGVFVTILFIPTIVLILAIATCILSLAYCKNKKIKTTIVCFAALSFIATIVCFSIHFLNGDGAQLNGLKNSDVNTIGLLVSAITLTALIILVAFLTDKTKLTFTTRSLTYGGVSIAMSFALSYLRIVKMPQGGSITLASLLPVMIYAYMFGTKKGVLIGAVYGLLQSIQDPFIIHPAQFILDYPLAFCCVGLCGIFKNNAYFENKPRLQFCIGAAIGGVARLVMHFLAGVFAFSTFAGDQNPFIYSFVYQASYILPDIAIVIAAGIFVFSSKNFVALTRSHDI